MTRREDLLERLEETVFALMMEEVISVEGRKALEENERLKNDESFVVPETAYRKGLDTIRRYFSKNARRTTMRTLSKLIPRVAVIVLILLLLFTTAFATIPEFRAKTMNLIAEVFDDRMRIEFGVVEQRASVSESDNLVRWVPEEFELVDKGETEISAWEKYCNSDEGFVEVNVYFDERVTYEIDTENAIMENIEVNGYPAVVVFKEDTIQIAIPRAENRRIYYVQAEGVEKDIVLQVTKSVNVE